VLNDTLNEQQRKVMLPPCSIRHALTPRTAHPPIVSEIVRLSMDGEGWGYSVSCVSHFLHIPVQPLIPQERAHLITPKPEDSHSHQGQDGHKRQPIRHGSAGSCFQQPRATSDHHVASARPLASSWQAMPKHTMEMPPEALFNTPIQMKALLFLEK